MSYNESVFSRILTPVLCLLILIGVPAVVFAEQKTVVVFSFENQSDDRNIDWIGEGLGELFIDRLLAEHDLYVFSREERLAAYGRLSIPETVAVSRATALRIAWEMGADAVVVGRFSGSHEAFKISARVLDLDGGSSAREVSVAGKLDDVIS